MSILYERIKSLCEERGIKIAQMCREAGVYQGTITDLKMGRSNSLSSRNLSKIASYFNVPIESLLDEEKPLVNNDEELTEMLEELRDRSDLRMLFSLTKNATKEDIQKTIQIIQMFRDGS